MKNLIYIKKNDHNIVQSANLIFNTSTGLLKINSEIISLTTGEEELLKALVQKANIVLSKEDILELLNKEINENNINALNVNIARLRKKIEINQKRDNQIREKFKSQSGSLSSFLRL